MKKFLIADDHAIVRTGAIVLIKELFPDAGIDECSDGDSAWKMIKSTQYDLLILDINMPGSDSLNLLKNISARQPALSILIMTINREEIYAKRYLQLNVQGFINKEANPEELSNAISTILEDKIYLSPKMRKMLLTDMLSGKQTKNPFEGLSFRELEIMGHLAEGKSPKEISGILSIHASTVGSYKSNIMHKLGVANVIELNSMVQSYPIR